MVHPENVALFRNNIRLARGNKGLASAMNEMIAKAKVYQDKVTKGMVFSLAVSDELSEAMSSIHEFKDVAGDLVFLSMNGIKFPNLPPDQFCDTLVAAADGA